VQEIVQKHFSLISESFFVDCVNCLIAFASIFRFSHTSMKSIELVMFCSNELARGNVVPLEKVAKSGEDATIISCFDASNQRHLSNWFPILTGFSGMVGSPHREVRIQ
jgi:guanine nucleotide-exchange factor